MKRHKDLILLLSILFSITLAGCGGGKDGKSDGAGGQKTGKGGVVYGGTLNVPQTEDFQTLYPHAITDLVSSHVASQLHEGLLKFDPRDMSVKNALAKEFSISEDGKVYKFKLRDNIKFHPDPCFKKDEDRRITTKDVRYSFRLLCTPSPNNQSFKGTFKGRVKGAQEYYDGEADSISGLHIIDEKTFEIELLRPSSAFKYILALPMLSIIPQKAIEKYGPESKIGAGPFKFASLKNGGDDLYLTRYENYHMTDSLGNELPFLDTVHFAFINSKVKQLSDFKSGKLHVIHGLPSEKIKSVVKEDISDFTGTPPKFILSRIPEMSTQFYEFNLTKNIFKDIHVRKAFSYAIDRERIVEKTLNGEAYGPGVHGITPPTFEGYDIEEIEGYSFNPEKAREHLKKAGYPEGKDFPLVKIELNSGGTKNTKVAFEIQKQLNKVLNINVDIEVVSFSKKLEDSKYANGDIFRSAWIADYPSPQNFLWLAYGKHVPKTTDEPSWPNVTRYQNPEFDKLYEKGRAAMNQDTAYKYFKKAEQVMINDAPMIILWYTENYRLLQSDVRNFAANPMKYFDFRKVYIKERTAKDSPGRSGKKKKTGKSS